MRLEVGRGTRRRPIGQDYAAAKDAEVGMMALRVKRAIGGRLIS